MYPQGTLIAVSSDLAPLYSTLNRQDRLETLQFLGKHLSQPFSCIASFSKYPEAKSNPLLWHSGPLYGAYWPATLRWSLLFHWLQRWSVTPPWMCNPFFLGDHGINPLMHGIKDNSAETPWTPLCGVADLPQLDSALGWVWTLLLLCYHG